LVAVVDQAGVEAEVLLEVPVVVVIMGRVGVPVHQGKVMLVDRQPECLLVLVAVVQVQQGLQAMPGQVETVVLVQLLVQV
jgi:hypothetical protein